MISLHFKLVSRKSLWLLLLLAGFVAGCHRSEPKPDLIILQTGRLRGNVYPDSFKGQIPLQHFPYIAGYVKEVREEAKREGTPVLLVDLGDSLQGSFASYATGAENMVTFFNTLEYDAVCLGNLDADLSPDVAAKISARVLCPFANEKGEPAMPGTSFAVSLPKGDLKISILSNFYGDADPKSDPLRFPAWFGPNRQPTHPVRDYQSVVDKLAADPANGIRLFAWMKFEPTDQPPSVYLDKLKALGVDAILAHRVYGRSERDVWAQSTSSNWDPPVSENILRDNLGFSVARLDLKKVDGKWTVLRRTLVPMTANNSKADPVIQAALKPLAARIDQADQMVATSAKPLSREEVFDLYMRLLTEIPDIEGVIYSEAAVRASLPAGPVRASALFNALPWQTHLVRLTLAPEDLEKLRGISSIRILKKGGASGPVHLATSEFFARLVEQRLGKVGRMEQVNLAESEFGFVLAALQARKEFTAEKPEGDWAYEP